MLLFLNLRKWINGSIHQLINSHFYWSIVPLLDCSILSQYAWDEHKAWRTKREALRLLECITFQKLFHPPFGVLFTFPSRYYPLLISVPNLALDGGPPRFGPGFTWPTLLRKSLPWSFLSITGLSPSMAVLSRLIHLENFNQIYWAPTTPASLLIPQRFVLLFLNLRKWINGAIHQLINILFLLIHCSIVGLFHSLKIYLR